jgi:hypothetical protein
MPYTVPPLKTGELRLVQVIPSVLVANVFPLDPLYPPAIHKPFPYATHFPNCVKLLEPQPVQVIPSVLVAIEFTPCPTATNIPFACSTALHVVITAAAVEVVQFIPSKLDDFTPETHKLSEADIVVYINSKYIKNYKYYSC